MSNKMDQVEAEDFKRQLIYGSLMLYGPETIPLRERALDRAILAALMGSSRSSPMKHGNIHTILRSGIAAVDIRPEIISETLRRLEVQQLIATVEVKKKVAYYLSEVGEKSLAETAGKAESLFVPALKEVLKHSGGVFDSKLAGSVFEDFLCTAFARFGSTIGAYLVGRHSQLADSVELAITFDEIASRHKLPDEMKASLKVRCLEFIKCKSVEARRLMLYLTQGYCFAQLLGVNRNNFDPMTEEAFKDSIFYADTNVLIAGVLPGDRGSAFSEVLSITTRVGASVRTTRATIDETRFTVAEKKATLNKIVEEVPEELGELSPDEFVVHFYEARRKNPRLTVDDFFADIEAIADVVRNRWGMTLEEYTEDELLDDVDTTEMSKLVQDAAIASRGYRKNEHVLRHDLAHLILVRKARENNPKTWFLTRDRVLINAASAIGLKEGTASPCFGMLGFLQSISPFVASSSEEESLASFFSGLLTDQVFIGEKLFDDRELVLMAETHADVMAMPADQVILAADYVKHQVLKGERYRTDTVPKVALELRKYLSANTEERQLALEARAAQGQAQYQAATAQYRRVLLLKTEAEARLQKSEEEREAEREARLEKENQISVFVAREASRKKRDQRIIAIGTVAFASICWLLTGHYWTPLGTLIANKLALSEKCHGYLNTAVTVIRFGLLTVPVLWLLKRSNLSANQKTGMYGFTIIFWIWAAGLAHSDGVGALSNVVTVSLFAALFIQDKWRGTEK